MIRYYRTLVDLTSYLNIHQRLHFLCSRLVGYSNTAVNECHTTKVSENLIKTSSPKQYFAFQVLFSATQKVVYLKVLFLSYAQLRFYFMDSFTI